MTPTQLRAAIAKLCDGNQSEMARVLGITDRAIRRRLAGAEIPASDAKLLRLMLTGRLSIDDVREA